MEFFNKKQEVIQIKLTEKGKSDLRDGIFNPVYYSFGDYPLVYDSRCFGLSGSQNQTSDQIKALNRPKLSVFPSTNFGNKAFKPEFFSPSVLGSAELGNENYPSFEVKLYNGHFSGTVSYITSTFLNQKVPTLTIQMKCIFETGSKQFFSHESLLMEINEVNGLFEKENFEYSFYKRRQITVPGLSGTVPIDQPLEFLDIKSINSVNIFDGNIDALFDGTAELSSSHVEYWVEIDVDENIQDIIDFENNQFSIYLKPENNKPPNEC